MANNIHLRKIDSTLLQEKVKELSTRLKTISQSGEAQTKEELVIEATKFLSSFFTRLGKPIFNPRRFIPGQAPNRDQFNEEFESLFSDLTILFSELDNLSKIVLSNYNFITSSTNRLTGKLKSISSKVDDYILFTNDANKDVLYFSDSFNNLSRIDFNSLLINTKQAEVDQAQGIITLPIDKSLFVPIQVTTIPVINNSSNGDIGNNHEFALTTHNDLMLILDNNADTWFEYEKVVSPTSLQDEPLILDITLNLTDTRIVNHIRINPNNFGVKTAVVIDEIATSLDGQTFTSIKDEVPNGNFILAADSSKFSGQGIFSFTPRKVKYVHLVFKQYTAYSINEYSTSAVKLRYAIGIRDIELSGFPYAIQGELISNLYELSTDSPIKKLALITHQEPIKSELASIEHFISVDNGTTWNAISSESAPDSNPLILSFNTSDIGSISTQLPISSFKYKALLQRNTEAFSNFSSALKQKIEDHTELHSVPDVAPFNIILDTVPIPNTLIVLDPLFGSRGIDDARFIIGTGTDLFTNLSMALPFQKIKQDLYKQDVDDGYRLVNIPPEEIRVNGELWTHGQLNTATYTDKIYQIDYEKGIVKTGNDTNGVGIHQGVVVDIKFKPERLYPLADEMHLAKLDFPTTNDKQAFTIKRYDPPAHVIETLSKGKKAHQLTELPYITFDTNMVFSDSSVFQTFQAFIDGVTELNTAGDWTVDVTTGIVYTYSETSITDTTTCGYFYLPIHILDTQEWEFGETTDLDHNVIITEKGWKTNLVKDEFVPDTRRYVATANLSMVKGTLTFSDTTVLNKEVDFIDGIQEFSKAIYTSEKIIASTLIGPAPIYTFLLRLPVVNSTEYSINFINQDVFATKVATSIDVDASGKWSIDLVTGIITVYIIGPLPNDLGKVSYYYNNYNKNSSNLYSVNYPTGEIYTSDVINSGVTMSYQYTDYRASYYIARRVSPQNYTFDISSNTLTLSSREILQRQRIINNTQSNMYHLAFSKIIENRDNISELEPYFTPILKDYAIKVITESTF